MISKMILKLITSVMAAYVVLPRCEYSCFLGTDDGRPEGPQHVYHSIALVFSVLVDGSAQGEGAAALRRFTILGTI